jgi:AcrR family transcriptional regulator
MSPVADTTRSVSEQRILGAARRRFERFGYRRTSIAEIAHDSGIAVGTVYRYVKTKEESILQVVEDLNATWLAQARQVLDEPGTPTERLARIGPASVKFNRENKLLSSILNRDTEMVSAPLLERIAEELLEQNVSMMAAVIREGVEEGAMRPVDPEKAAFILFVAGQTLFNQEHHPYEDLMPLLAEIVLEGLLPR